eukprot:scaffold243327_cov26-Prasinocladus_malaysianus.AAC.1
MASNGYEAIPSRKVGEQAGLMHIALFATPRGLVGSPDQALAKLMPKPEGPRLPLSHSLLLSFACLTVLLLLASTRHICCITSAIK